MTSDGAEKKYSTITTRSLADTVTGCVLCYEEKHQAIPTTTQPGKNYCVYCCPRCATEMDDSMLWAQAAITYLVSTIGFLADTGHAVFFYDPVNSKYLIAVNGVAGEA